MTEPGIETLEMDPRLAPRGDNLHPAELPAIEQAVEKRQRQYTAGRLLARKLLGRHSSDNSPLVSDAQRVPRWPEGVVGCITHTDSWCAVSIAPSAKYRGVGIDVEPATPLSGELWTSIARGEELEWVNGQPESQRGLLCKGLFSAKESIYKSLYPTVRVFLGFEGMHIALRHLEKQRYSWTATLRQDWGVLKAGTRFEGGHMAVSNGHLATGIALPRTLPLQPNR